MARSTRPEMAPSLPPKTDELELELDVDEDEDEIESGRGERGGEGGCGLAWRRRVGRALCGVTVCCLERTVFDLAESAGVALEGGIAVMSTSSAVGHA